MLENVFLIYLMTKSNPNPNDQNPKFSEKIGQKRQLEIVLEVEYVFVKIKSERAFNCPESTTFSTLNIIIHSGSKLMSQQK